MPNLEFIIKLLTADEWTALILIGLVVYSGTEIAKRVHRKLTKRYGNFDVWFFALALGFVSSWVLWPDNSSMPWYVLGIITGPALSWLHTHAIKIIAWKWPGLAAALTGNRRKTDNGPPNGGENKRK